LCIDCQKVITPKLAIPIRSIFDVGTIRGFYGGTRDRPVLEAKINKIVARMDLVLSKFEGVGVLGLVWDYDSYNLFEDNSHERFIDAALISREEVHALLKAALHWADDDLPEVHILNSEGDRVESSQ
jgi:hypothetical protein